MHVLRACICGFGRRTVATCMQIHMMEVGLGSMFPFVVRWKISMLEVLGSIPDCPMLLVHFSVARWSTLCAMLGDIGMDFKGC